MKKQSYLAGALLAIMMNATSTNAQTWSWAGDVVTTGSVLGTNNAEPLLFRVNGAQSGKIDFSGTSALTSYGFQSLLSNSTGINNTATGYQSLFTNAIGYNNTAHGYKALYNNGLSALQSSQGSENTAIGAMSLATNALGSYNTATGESALRNNLNGGFNTATGNDALYTNLFGNANTATGGDALYSNSTGNSNTAIGYSALRTDTTGSYNTAAGAQALYFNSGSNNSALGYQSLYSNTSGTSNTAAGYQSLYLNTASNNTAFGYRALYSNGGGSYNTATGVEALRNNSSSYNTANGYQSLYSNSSGNSNTATGFQALYTNLTGSNNTANGYYALRLSTGNYNTAVGRSALTNTTGSYNTAIGYSSGSAITGQSNNSVFGYSAGTSFSVTSATLIGYNTEATTSGYTNVAAFGYNTTVNASNKIRFGNSAVTVVEGNASYTVSDARFKTNVKENVAGLDFINKLRPVTYKFEAKKFDEFLRPNASEEDKAAINATDYREAESLIHSGFIAQELESAAKESGFKSSIVHAPTNVNDNYSVAYGEMVVPLVKAVQELSAANESMKHQLLQMQDCVASLCSNMELQRSVEITKSSAGLMQNQPNPFNSQTEIKYQLPTQFSAAKIIVTDAKGESIRTFNLKSSSSIIINAGEMAAGLYYYTLQVDGKTIETKQLILTK